MADQKIKKAKIKRSNTMKHLLRIAPGILVAVIILTLATLFQSDLMDSAFATNDKCPDDKVCYEAKHKQTGKIMCRHNDNDPWQWILPKKRCGLPKQITKTAMAIPTKTPLPPLPPTSTPVSPTDIPNQPDQPDQPVQNVNTPTASIVPAIASTPTPQCEICYIWQNIMFAEQTQAAAQSTMVAP